MGVHMNIKMMLKKIKETFSMEARLLNDHNEHFTRLLDFSKVVPIIKEMDLNEFIIQHHTLKLFGFMNILVQNEDLEKNKSIIKSFIFYYIRYNLPFLFIDNINLFNDADILEIAEMKKMYNYHYQIEIKFELFHKFEDLYKSSFIINTNDEKIIKEASSLIDGEDYKNIIKYNETHADKINVVEQHLMNSLQKDTPFEKYINVITADIIKLKRNNSEKYEKSNWHFYDFIRLSKRNGFRLLNFCNNTDVTEDEYRDISTISPIKIKYIHKHLDEIDKNILDDVRRIKYEQVEKLRDFMRIRFNNINKKSSYGKCLDDLNNELLLEVAENIKKIQVNDEFICHSKFLNEDIIYGEDPDDQKSRYDARIIKIK
jgi:hypothetical protein